METKICKKCGRENYVDMKFCSECGSSFSKKTEEEELIFCPECGTKNKATEKFCEECGSNLNEEQDEESEEEIDTSKEETSSEEPVEEKTEEEDDEEYIFCPECGTKNKVTEKFCEECGSNLNEDQDDEEEIDTSEKELIEEKKAELKSKDKEEKPVKKVTTKVSEKKKDSSENSEEPIQTKNIKKSQKKSNSKKPKLLIIVVIILIIAIAGGVCYKTGIIDNLLSKKSEPKTEIKKDGWSDWVEKLPKDITEKNYTIEKKTEYASKTKKTKTSNKKALKGWTLYDTENASGDQTETVKGIEEIKKFEVKDSIKITNKENIKEKYTAILCGYYTTPKDKNRFYSPKTAKPYCEEEDSYSLTEESEERNSGTYKVGDDYQDKSYTNSDGNTIYYKVIKVTPTEVEFTYQTSEGAVYHFYKWSSWSKYSDKKVEEDENTKVKTRTVYRYKSKTK